MLALGRENMSVVNAREEVSLISLATSSAMQWTVPCNGLP